MRHKNSQTSLPLATDTKPRFIMERGIDLRGKRINNAFITILEMVPRSGVPWAISWPAIRNTTILTAPQYTNPSLDQTGDMRAHGDALGESGITFVMRERVRWSNFDETTVEGRNNMAIVRRRLGVLAPYQQRVVDEKKDLDTRISALTDFLASATFKDLCGDERNRLKIQKRLMVSLSSILGKRIANF